MSGISDAITALIKTRGYVDLFRLLAALETTGAKRFPIHQELALMYPVLSDIVHEARGVKDCEGFFLYADDYDSVEADFWTTMLWINTAFINKTKCDCGEEVNLFSDTEDTNYGHHFHPVFREWAYKHMTEERRKQLIRAEAEGK